MCSVFLIFFGVHTTIALAPGGKLLAPYVLSFIGAVIIICINVNRIKFSTVGLYGVLTLFLVTCAVITAQKDGALPQHIISTGQLLYALVIAYGTFLGLQVCGIRWASRFFLLAAIVLIVGSFLELYGGFKPVSDAFRNAVNSWHAQDIYNNDLRDLQDYGGIRPKFFAPEPAVLGSMTGFAILFWFLSARRLSGFRLLGASCLTVAALFLIRSPTTLLCGVIIFIFYLSELGRSRISRMRTAVVGVTALTVILIAPGIVNSTTNYGGSVSFFMRELSPPMVTAEVLQSQPFLGTGIGGWAQVVPFGESVFAHAGGSSYRALQRVEITDPDVAKSMLASALWEFWVDLGLMGGILVIWLLWRTMGQLAIPHRFVVFISGAIILTMGGAMVSPRHWVGLFTLACLDQMRTALANEEEALHPKAELIPAAAGFR
jgi:hypothetical protein